MVSRLPVGGGERMSVSELRQRPVRAPQPPRGVDRVPPHNLEAEESLLGAMLLSREAIAEAIELVSGDDFYKPAHAHLFDAVLALYGAGEPADPVTVAEELRRAGVLDAVGGKAALLRIQAAPPASANAGHYARIVEELALLRRLIQAAGEIAEMGYSLPDDVDEVLDFAESRVFEVGQRRVTDSLELLRTVLMESLDQLEALYGNTVTVTGVPTGYVDLDEKLLGLQPSNLVVVAARPAQGKTSFALGAASYVAVQAKRPVLFFSMEMSHLELAQRLLSAEARVDARKLRTGRLEDADWARISHAAGRLGEAPFYIDDNPHCTVMEMRARARRTKSKHGDLALIVIDYLQLMTTPGRAESRQVEVSELSRGLKILARDLHTPVLALSQLNRMPEMRQDKHPVLADLRESGCLTADTRIIRSDTGEAVTIGQLLAAGEDDIPIWTLDHDYRLARGTMSRVFRSGVKPVYRLRMRSGIEVKASANHPFLTLDGWRRLDQLSQGERLAVPRRLPDPDKPADWTEDEAVLLAHLLAGGTFVDDQPLHYTSTEPAHVDVVEKAARRLGVRGRRVDRGPWCQYYLAPPYHPMGWRPNRVVAFLERLGLYGRRRSDAVLPGETFGLERPRLAFFLRHLWAAGGHAVAAPGRAVLTFPSPSRDLVAGLQLLLLRFGIISRIHALPGPGGGPTFELRIASPRSRRRFLAEIGVPAVTEVAARGLARLLAGVDHPSTGAGFSPPPAADRAEPRPAYASGMGTTFYGARRVEHDARAAMATQEIEGDEASLTQTDLVWDRVESIELIGDMPVYDATVPGTQNFVANGLVVHNSIEQDADVVTFIYRDELYNPETTDQRGMAEIIVAKHRNGPTGTVRLAFIEHLAKFENMARGD